MIYCSCCSMFSQEIPVKKDSAKVFRDIEKYSKKRKFTKFIHKLIFEPVSNQQVVKSSKKNIRTNYAKFEGKIIRKINITTLDPFGYYDGDTTKIPKKWEFKFGNALHVKSKNFAISNLLLFRKNQPLDSLLVKESERLVRSQRFVRSITSNCKLIGADSVDVSIRVLDSWSLIPDFSGTTSKSNFYLKERNFFGIGHEFSNSYSKSLSTSTDGFSTRYTIPNIRNTFISMQVSYDEDLDNAFSKAIIIERPFFSPYARWGAGINIGQNLTKSLLLNQNQLREIQDIKYNFQDYWVGHSNQIFKGNSEYNRTTNLITSARYFTKKFTEKPFLNADSLTIYEPEKLYLIGLGISSRKFTQDKYLFDFNVIEDVASGFVYNLTAGYQKKYANYQFYTGAKMAIGSYFDFGYLSGNFEYGTFVKNGKTNQSTSSFKLIYFTNIIEIGQWKVRQFIKPQLIIGTSRLDTNADKVTLNGESGISGFDSKTLFGTKKALLTFQTQGYSPWRVLGFRLNPYLSYTGGLLGLKDSDFKKSKLYSQIGLGVIVSNDYLVFNSFQFSFSFYPNSPDGNSVFKTNSVSTSDFGLQGFEISKPILVDYR